VRVYHRTHQEEVEAMITPLPPNTPVCLNRLGGARFVLVEPIGQGGFGITYKATDRPFDNSPVVVKELACEGVCWRNPQTLELEPAGTRERGNMWEYRGTRARRAGR
jgi:hypothetical protein